MRRQSERGEYVLLLQNVFFCYRMSESERGPRGAWMGFGSKHWVNYMIFFGIVLPVLSGVLLQLHVCAWDGASLSPPSPPLSVSLSLCV